MNDLTTALENTIREAMNEAIENVSYDNIIEEAVQETIKEAKVDRSIEQAIEDAISEADVDSKLELAIEELDLVSMAEQAVTDAVEIKGFNGMKSIKEVIREVLIDLLQEPTMLEHLTEQLFEHN